MDWFESVKDVFALVMPFLDRVPVVRALLGIILVFFLPGLAWTLVFFRGKQINFIERFVLSIGLSIALVTLSILAANVLFNVTINGANNVMIISALIVVPLIIYGLNKLIGRGRVAKQ